MTKVHSIFNKQQIRKKTLTHVGAVIQKVKIKLNLN